MKINRMSVAAGLTVGLLAAGAGGAVAATSGGSRAAGTSSTRTSRARAGWDRYGYGWGDAGTAWKAPATGAGWGARPGEPAGPLPGGGW